VQQAVEQFVLEANNDGDAAPILHRPQSSPSTLHELWSGVNGENASRAALFHLAAFHYLARHRDCRKAIQF